MWTVQTSFLLHPSTKGLNSSGPYTRTEQILFCHIWLHLCSSPLVSTATTLLCEDSSLGGKSRSVLCSVEKNREIKNNKAQHLEGCSLSVTAPIRTQGDDLLSHSPSPLHLSALKCFK